MFGVVLRWFVTLGFLSPPSQTHGSDHDESSKQRKGWPWASGHRVDTSYLVINGQKISHVLFYRGYVVHKNRTEKTQPIESQGTGPIIIHASSQVPSDMCGPP